MSKAPQVSDRTRKRIQEVEKKLLAYEGGADSKLVKEVGPDDDPQEDVMGRLLAGGLDRNEMKKALGSTVASFCAEYKRVRGAVKSGQEVKLNWRRGSKLATPVGKPAAKVAVPGGSGHGSTVPTLLPAAEIVEPQARTMAGSEHPPTAGSQPTSPAGFVLFGASQPPKSEKVSFLKTKNPARRALAQPGTEQGTSSKGKEREVPVGVLFGPPPQRPRPRPLGVRAEPQKPSGVSVKAPAGAATKSSAASQTKPPVPAEMKPSAAGGSKFSTDMNIDDGIARQEEKRKAKAKEERQGRQAVANAETAFTALQRSGQRAQARLGEQLEKKKKAENVAKVEKGAGTRERTGKGGVKQKAKSDKQRKEEGEAAYEPSGESEYEDEKPGQKRKPKGQHRQAGKKVKSAATVDDTDKEEGNVSPPTPIPTIRRPQKVGKQPKSAEFVESSDEEKQDRPATDNRPTDKAPKGGSATKSGEKRASTKKKRGGEKLRSNYMKHLPADTVEFLTKVQAMPAPDMTKMLTFRLWLEKVYKEHPHLKPTAKPREKPCKGVVNLGQTLKPPNGLVLSKSPCDYCAKFCPFRCLVIDEGTSCLVCNYFRHTACKKNGESVMQRGAQPGDDENDGNGDEEDGETDGEEDGDDVLPSIDEARWEVVEQAQARQDADLREIKSKMDAMTLGMAACGSLLKNASSRIDHHRSETGAVSRQVEQGTTALSSSLERLRQGREQLELLKTPLPHTMLERHINNLNDLTKIGVEFAACFKQLTDDAHAVTEALAEWLGGQSAGDVDMEGDKSGSGSGSEESTGEESEGDGDGEEEVEETGKEQDVISVSSGSVKSDVPMIIE